MAKSANQKMKLLYLMRILSEETDEQHPMSMREIISALEARGVTAERKSLYDDIECLRLFGLDVESTRTDTTRYYLAARDFELPELKLLVDSVQAAKFITPKKTLSLIGKIERLASVHEARQLRRQVYIANRVKSPNEGIYYNVDSIHGAIAANRRISFRYYEYTVTKQRRFRRNGARYEVSPFALIWDDENYYLVAYDSAEAKIKHFRVDKMNDIARTEQPRDGVERLRAMDMAQYTQKNFGMFGGQESRVVLEFEESLVGVVLDRFGADVSIIGSSEGRFTVSVMVAVSPQFFAWLFGFGDSVRIIGPEEVAGRMRQLALSVAKLYE